MPESDSKSNKPVPRRDFLKWSAALAAIGVVGVGVGLGADVILRSGATTKTLTDVTTATQVPATQTVSDVSTATATATATATSTATATATTTEVQTLTKVSTSTQTPSQILSALPTTSSTAVQTVTEISTTTQPPTTITTSSSSPTITTSQTIVDALGRTVVIPPPSELYSIVTLHPQPDQALWRLAPQKQVDIDRVFNSRLSTFLTDPADLAFLNSLPVVGMYADPPNEEQVIGLAPDLILTMTGDANVNTYEETYGCPAIACVKNTLNDYTTSFGLVGQAVGNMAAANQLINYWNNEINKVTTLTAQVPQSAKLKVYYGSHNSPLTTPGTSTIMSSIISLAGGIGYTSANPTANATATSESLTTNLEQLVEWNPDVIVVTSVPNQQTILTSSQWADIAAVVNNKVYVNPVEETLDGTNCLMGLVWLASTLYPSIVDLNLYTECQSYYSLFNHYNSLTLAQTQLPGQGW